MKKAITANPLRCVLHQTTGLSLPLLLTHSALIQPTACWMSIAGGVLVYGTIMVYAGWFGGGSEEEF